MEKRLKGEEKGPDQGRLDLSVIGGGQRKGEIHGASSDNFVSDSDPFDSKGIMGGQKESRRGGEGKGRNSGMLSAYKVNDQSRAAMTVLENGITPANGKALQKGKGKRGIAGGEGGDGRKVRCVVEKEGTMEIGPSREGERRRRWWFCWRYFEERRTEERGGWWEWARLLTKEGMKETINEGDVAAGRLSPSVGIRRSYPEEKRRAKKGEGVALTFELENLVLGGWGGG